MIRVKEVTKIYKTKEIETFALDNVSFDIHKGEFIAVMGPSGCGKSTLLNILGMLDSPSTGQYEFFDQEVSTYSKKQLTNLRLNIGFVFQNYNLIDELDVYKNIELPLIYKKMGTREREKSVNEILDRLGLSTKKKSLPQQLSGGQQQRVAIARAAVGSPKVILADEPTGNLDSNSGHDVMDLLTELNEQGTTIIMVTHSPSHASCAHRTIYLFDGKLTKDAKEAGFENYSFPKKFF